MKNISVTINPNAITSVAAPSMLGVAPVNKTTSVAFSMQFDNEMAALAFTKFMLDNIQNYKAGGV